jgi:hypothetical protein
MSISNFVGRSAATTHLKKILEGRVKCNGKLTVQSIEGPGGIGKTSLFDHALAASDIDSRNYLTLRITGNDVKEPNLVRLISKIIAGADASALTGKPPGFYFSATTKAIKTIDDIRNEAIAELKKKYPNNNDEQGAFAKVIDYVLETGKTVNDAVPATKKRIDFNQMKNLRPILDDAAIRLSSLQIEPIPFLERMGLGSTHTFRNSIKQNSGRLLASELISDLSAILHRYKKEDRFKATHKKVQGIDRLLLVIDDYETVQGSIGEFLTSSLLPSLKKAIFETVVVILGRDQLTNTHPAWEQHLESCMQRSITVKALSRKEMDQLIGSFEIKSTAEKERAWQDTEGYPFYVQLWVEEAESGGRSAVMLKRFYDRTTRWMNDQQKVWLQKIIFIDAVNISTLSLIFSNREEVDAAFDWFKSEGSVRDTTGAEFKVRAYLRSRLLDYLKITDPDQYQTLRGSSTALGLMAV